ncbi:unnamed protein product [Cylicostephanus goldi]|uniref:Uncharacterized protein n=1 Tax=Cylicostephanus goldi TaxID=71465 RepID=A0A3P6RT60_CYLGO|nr:unnamed protein product [Cylicostephanus goldi]
MQIDRREDECVQISQLPIGNLVKKTILLKGRQYAVELKLLKTIDHENMPVLKFQDLLELTRALHEYDAEMEVSFAKECKIQGVKYWLMRTKGTVDPNRRPVRFDALQSEG